MIIEQQISKPKLYVRLQQMNNPPKGETRTAMMPIEYNQPQVIYDFRTKYQKNYDEKNAEQKSPNKRSSLNKGELKNQSQDASKIIQAATPQSAKKGDQDKSLDKSKNDVPVSVTSLPAGAVTTNGQEQNEETKENQKQKFTHKEISLWRRRVKKFLKNAILVWFLRTLTFAYLLLMFVSIAVQQMLNEDDAYLASVVINSVELNFLACFIFEIILSAYAQGIQNYRKEKLQILDSFIIFLTLILVILDLGLGRSPTFTKIASVVKGMFRFFRIVLLFRKASKFKKINVSSSIKTPAERIIDVFSELKEFFDSKEIVENLEWCVNIIASNKLYETNIIHGGEKNGDMAQWINYGARQDEQKEENEKQVVQTKPQDTKLQPYISNIPSQIIERFKDVNEIHFDCFDLEKISEGQETSFLLLYLFSVNNILSSVEIDPIILNNFFKQIEQGYKNNLYHNRLHAFDVLQTANFFLKACNFVDIAGLNEFELGTIYISAACHDYDHPQTIINKSYKISYLFRYIIQNIQTTFTLKDKEYFKLRNIFWITRKFGKKVLQNFFNKNKFMSLSLIY